MSVLRRINSTLMHMRNVTDFYTVLDTGSEDSTVDVVRELMSGVPGQIIQHGPLKSFADARNHALKVRQSCRMSCTGCHSGPGVCQVCKFIAYLGPGVLQDEHNCRLPFLGRGKTVQQMCWRPGEEQHGACCAVPGAC